MRWGALQVVDSVETRSLQATGFNACVGVEWSGVESQPFSVSASMAIL
jgi:hypothetical protein